MRISRRSFMKAGIATGAAIALPWSVRWPPALAGIEGGSLDPADIARYRMPMVIPPAMPRTGARGRNLQYYEIAVRQFRQQILPSSLPPTTVWSYGSVHHPGTFHYPAFTIEAAWRTPVRVKWVNDLVDANGDFLPHLLPVDPTLHWANPPGGVEGRDMRPVFDETPGPYTGPVPIVTHLHGAAGVGDESDGYAEAWYLPKAANIDPRYAKVGTWYKYFRIKAQQKFGQAWTPGSAVFQYPNDHRAATLWYHDHTLGMTRANVYAGPAGFYLVRGGPDDQVMDTRTGTKATLPGPAPALGDPPDTRHYEIPIAIQDRSFNDDGSLFYPDSREFFDGATADEPGYIPDTDLSPIWNPEFFGNTIVVNGRTWPFLDVERRRYRFRLLNGCNSRFLVLKFDHPDVEVWQIGTEAGFLPSPINLNELDVGGLGGVLVMSLAERADLIVDFTNLPAGTSFRLLNLGPDEPFRGFPTPASDPDSTGQVMEFRVVAASGSDSSTPPWFLELPAIEPLIGGSARPLSLLEKPSGSGWDGPAEAELGTFDPATGIATDKEWAAPITENPALGATEVWELYNFTEDAHPIHIHEIHFQVVDRQSLGDDNLPTGAARPPEPWETGFKDTVIAYPGEVTRVRGRFDVPGLFVWHCHIVEHEDNEMMRPYAIGPIPTPVL
ncbi:MAG TPA: multicopper oxidase [Actinomycetota bacterium]|nr:multicopper oxidase [Actinomycetota bacterium]